MTTTTTTSLSLPPKYALILCDLQSDWLHSIPNVSQRQALLDRISIAIQAALQAHWTIIFTGLAFPSGYGRSDDDNQVIVSPHHKLYGGFQRLNAKLGDEKVHWFMKGYPGTEIVTKSLLQLRKEQERVRNDENNNSGINKDSFFNENDDVHFVWRQQHLPSSELLDLLDQKSITDVHVMGIKAAYSVQITCQVLCDWHGGKLRSVNAVRDCIDDDDPQRLQAVLQHVLPIYANVIPLTELLDQAVGGALETFSVQRSLLPSVSAAASSSSSIRYYCDCGRGGHMAMILFHLQKQKRGWQWQPFPTQHWYADFTRSYQCPLGKAVVEFCDEPRFSSRICVYIKGREWLDEKEKCLQLADDFIPTETYLIRNGKWVSESSSPPLANDDDKEEKKIGPWFVKEADKNGGRNIDVCATLEEAKDCASRGSSGDNTMFVIQRHIPDPLLTTDGRKCHIKFYNLLVSTTTTTVPAPATTTTTWGYYSCTDAFLCTSPNPWSSNDSSKETQITVKRHVRMASTNESIPLWQTIPNEPSSSWPNVYRRCQTMAATVIERAIAQGKLQDRGGVEGQGQQHDDSSNNNNKLQFEIFSADFMLDCHNRLWLIEFNFTPVLFDPEYFSDPANLTTAGLKAYYQAYQSQGEEAVVNDREMVQEAIALVFTPSPNNNNNNNNKVCLKKWDLVKTFHSTDKCHPPDTQKAVIEEKKIIQDL